LELVQNCDPQLKKELSNNTRRYKLKDFHGGGKIRSLICYNNNIVVPKHLEHHAIDWYRITLCHPGEQKKPFHNTYFAPK
jgi:hypothetical protein